MSDTLGEPSTPENKGRMQMNRSFTLPPKLDTSQNLTPSEAVAAEGIETLYIHPHTSVIKFTTKSLTPRPGVSNGRGLPWKSPTETTLAAGPLEIYRVPNTVSFLRSGNLLHAIMPRSQCWCVDGVSKFAMRVLPDTYYRVELPGETEEDLELVQGFKTVLGKVMHYERTACPFARESDEELPELEDIRNRRLRPGDSPQWLLDRSRLRKTTNASASPPKAKSPERIVLRKRLTTEDKPEVTVEERVVEPLTEAQRSVTAPPAMLVKPLDPSLRSAFEHASTPTDLRPFQAIPTDMPPSPPDSSAGLDSREADMLREALAIEIAEAMQLEDSQAADALPEDIDSSVLVHDAIPEPAAEGLDQPVSKLEVSDGMTATEEQAQATDIAPDAAAEPAPLQRSISNPDDPFAAIQARILARRSIGGTTSFYPSTVRQSTTCSTSSINSSSSSLSHSSNIAQQRNLAKELVRKACAAFIGPPAHVVALMLRIAARFANGTFGRMFFVESPSGFARRIPGSFDINDEISSAESLSDDEDDFGVPLHSPVRLVAAKHLRERKVRGAGEVD